MKNIIQGLLAVSYAISCNAAVLRGDSARRAETTTTGPLINAILETERFLNGSVKRFNSELDAMSSDLSLMNKSIGGWGFSIKVLDNTSTKDAALIANNTKLLKATNDAAGYKIIADRTKKVHETVVAYNASQEALVKALAGEDPNSASTKKESSSSGDDGDLDLLPRVEKAKRIYLLNGTMIERRLRKLKGIESELSVNSTLVAQRILRRKTNEAMTEIPKEMQRRLEATLKGSFI